MSRKTRESRARRKRVERLREQHIAVAVRAKYGPRRRPAAVVIRSLESGDVVKVVTQRSLAGPTRRMAWRPREVA